jgi:transposase-like protein
MNIDKENMRPLYTRIAMALLSGITMKKVALHLGLSPSTIYRIWKNDEFRLYYRELEDKRNEKAVDRTSIIEKTTDVFAKSAERAAEMLVQMMDSEQDSARRKSLCDDILDRGIGKAKDFLDINSGKPIEIVLSDPGNVKENFSSKEQRELEIESELEILSNIENEEKFTSEEEELLIKVLEVQNGMKKEDKNASASNE